MEYHTSNEAQVLVAIEQESFLIFPTSTEHRREL